MKMTILGSGNVATYFGLGLHKQGWDIQQVYSPQLVNAVILSKKINAQPTDRLTHIKDADIFIIAVRDDAFDAFKDLEVLKGKILIHCSGSNILELFADTSDQLGVIWPLYSVNKEHLPETRNIPLIIDASTEVLLNIMHRIAAAVTDNIHHLDNEQRSYLHLNAVLSNNFTNHLYAMAEEVCRVKNIDFTILQPIITQSIHNVLAQNLAERQTGPAIRNDFNTIQKHMQMLESMGLDKNVYQSITESILQFKNKR